jgi:NAD/NADP transhydrogenase alpha subunit
MRVGCPREIEIHEYRVGLTPGAVREYVAAGHEVVVEEGAGLGIAAPDAAYISAGGILVSSPRQVFATSDLIIKLKEPHARRTITTRTANGFATANTTTPLHRTHSRHQTGASAGQGRLTQNAPSSLPHFPSLDFLSVTTYL